MKWGEARSSSKWYLGMGLNVANVLQMHSQKLHVLQEGKNYEYFMSFLEVHTGGIRMLEEQGAKSVKRGSCHMSCGASVQKVVIKL